MSRSPSPPPRACALGRVLGELDEALESLVANRPRRREFAFGADEYRYVARVVDEHVARALGREHVRVRARGSWRVLAVEAPEPLLDVPLVHVLQRRLAVFGIALEPLRGAAAAATTASARDCTPKSAAAATGHSQQRRRRWWVLQRVALGLTAVLVLRWLRLVDLVALVVRRD